MELHDANIKRQRLRRRLCQWIKRKRKKVLEGVAKDHAEVNLRCPAHPPPDNWYWTKYFEHIKSVCPWSRRAHMNNDILFIDYSDTTFNTWRSLFRAKQSFEAYVYKCRNVTSDWLESKCDYLNSIDEHSEWLFSHPDGGENSTVIPVLIQQNAQQLNELREDVGYYEDESRDSEDAK